MKYIIGLWILLFTASCSPKIDWSQECANRFPPTTKYIKGDTKTVTDTIIEPGLIIQADPILRIVKCPPSKTIYTTKTTVDTIETEGIGTKAKISGLQRDLKENEVLLQKWQESSDKAVELARNRTHQRNCLIVGMGLLIAWNCRKLLSKLISPFL